MSGYQQQTSEKLEANICQLEATMQTGSWERKTACSLQIQPMLNELARRDQNEQTETMLKLNRAMVDYTKWMTGLTVAITVMTVINLGVVLYAAFWRS